MADTDEISPSADSTDHRGPCSPSQDGTDRSLLKSAFPLLSMLVDRARSSWATGARQPELAAFLRRAMEGYQPRHMPSSGQMVACQHSGVSTVSMSGSSASLSLSSDAAARSSLDCLRSRAAWRREGNSEP